MKPRTKSLMDATGDEVIKLRYGNLEAGDYWLLSDGYAVTVSKQKTGEPAAESITVPVKEFRKLIKGFIKQQRYG